MVEQPAADAQPQAAKKKKKSKKGGKRKQTDAQQAGLPAHLDLQRTHVICGPDVNYHVNTVTSALAYMSVGYDNAWDFAKWSRDFDIRVTRREPGLLEFEMAGVDPAIVNALRRILIAEVPTVAIEHVFVIDNTSEMAEEVLSHRLGLVPLNVDAEQLQARGSDEGEAGAGKPCETNTVVFKLCIDCRKVLAGDLQWLPAGSEYPDETGTHFSGSQEAAFAEAPAPVHPDILLCKLAPGQRIELEAHAVWGQGWDHAKWSPVATAWHRLYPELAIKKAVPKDTAQELAERLPEVFSVAAKQHPHHGWLQSKNIRHYEHYLERARDLSAEEAFQDYIEVRKRKEHAIFTIEPCVAVPAEQLFMRALSILRHKCMNLQGML